MKPPQRNRQQIAPEPTAPYPRWRRVILATAAIAAVAGTALCLSIMNPPDSQAAAFEKNAPVTTAGGGDSTSVRFDGKTYTNRLIDSHDPYLLLHAHNPVDWHPWGPEALEQARRENKPIFLSVGYSTCYWCHVAEREIYSNPEIATLMNQWFINIKVDREQRPDVDRVYMLATQTMTGHGGWPNNVFLTPDLKPFFAGSYFPPQDQGGRPGFSQIMASLHQSWVSDHAKVVAVSEQVYQSLQDAESRSASSNSVSLEPARWLDLAVQQAAAQFDEKNSGFSGGDATMFPQEPVLSMLLAARARGRALPMATATLQAMAEGGVMDQLAGGFHRYSTDPNWSVPHFEKMLYDNAQLLSLYSQAYALTKRPLFGLVAQRTAHYLTAEMQAPDGGFYSAQDAEVSGVEGESYVWTRMQIEALLTPAEVKQFFALYVLVPMPTSHAGQKQTSGGVLRLDRDRAEALARGQKLPAAIAALLPQRAKLLAARNLRPQPARDEKIVLADNALTTLGFVQASIALDDKAMMRTALDTANWAWSKAFDGTKGLLRHQFFHGHAGDDGFLDDYALLGQAFLALHAATGDAVWQSRAQQVADAMLKRFLRPDGRLVTTADTTGLLISPPTEGDSVQPSGQSAAVALLLGLSADGGSERYAATARRALASLSSQIASRPYGWGALLTTLSQASLVAALEKVQPRSVKQVASRLPSSADHVQIQARIASTKAGNDLVVTVVIEDGYHINANPASDPDLIPTQLMLDGQPDLRVNYPPAQVFKAPFASQGIAVYSGQVQLKTTLSNRVAAPASASLRVQACNDQFCLMPATIEVPLPEISR